MRLIPALSAAWAPPRLPAILTLGALAAASGPGVVTLVARVVGTPPRAARPIVLAATLETAFALVAMTLPFASHRRVGAAVAWLALVVLAAGSGALAGLPFVWRTRLGTGRPRTELGFAVLATLLLGAGVGTAAGVPPFVTCFLASVLIVNASPQRHAVRAVLVEGERPSYAVLLVVTGALLALPTAWILVAAPVLLGLRAVAKWAAVRFGGSLLGLARGSRERGGLGTIAQGGVVVALGLSYALLYGGAGPLLTTIVLLVAAARLSAVPLWTFALGAGRQRVAGIRTEADGLVGTSRELRGRIVAAADAAQARLADLDARFEVVQEEVEPTVLDVAATLRTVRRGLSLLEWGRRTLKRGKRSEEGRAG